MPINEVIQKVFIGSNCRFAALGALMMVGLLITGCAAQRGDMSVIENPAVEHYDQIAESIEYEDVGTAPIQPLQRLGDSRLREEPPTDQRRAVSLSQAIQIGLQNSQVFRQNAQFLSSGNPLLTNPDAVPSIYDVEIQNNGVLFGSRGLDAALSDFDPRFSSSMQWGRDENVQNNTFLGGGLPPGGVLADENAQFQSRIEQQLLTGGIFAINHTWDYSQNNQPGRLFGSAYTGVLGAEFRQPLGAGAGREFTAIAGPSSQRARGFSYVNQGIVIAKINSKLSEIDFQENVQSFVRDIGELYWDLYQTWREYEAEKAAAQASEKLWNEIRAKFTADLVGSAEEAQVEDGFQEAVVRRDLALSTFFQTEARLRRLLGLPIDDGLVLVPGDDPVEIKVTPDRAACLYEAYLNRLELRRQKTNIQSLQLQLSAAKNLVKPRLDFVAGYKLNGFGDKLIAGHTADGTTGEGFNSAYNSLLRGKETSWNLGFEYSIPLWLRSERSQLRQLELRLVKAHSTLAAQENEIAHELNSVYQTLQRWYQSARTNKRRVVAATRRVEAAEAEYKDVGRTGIDPVLRAEISLTQAKIAYHRSLGEYNKSLRDLIYRMGRLACDSGIEIVGSDGLPMDIRPISASAGADIPLVTREGGERPIRPSEFARPQGNKFASD